MKQKKNIFFRVNGVAVVMAMSLLVWASHAHGGMLDFSGTPASTGYTLSDIYTRIATNGSATEGSHGFSPSAGPAPSFHTLQEIYEAIPTIFPETVKLGTTYMGIVGTLAPNGGTAGIADVFGGKTAHLTGDWTLDTGTLSLACDTGTFDGVANIVSDEYDGSGNGSNRWCMGDSGDADASSILSGKIAWVDGIAVTGSMPTIGQQTITPGTSNVAITAGYHDGTGFASGDADLVSGNIRSGVNIFGIDGNSNVVNTSSGDAVAGDIKTGKIAWVDGASVTGNFASDTKTATLQGEVVTPDSGKWLSSVTVAITNLTASNVKQGATVGGVAGTAVSGFPGSNWVPNGSGDGSTPLNQTNCENAANWKWFEDGNGDGDTTDAADGECIRTATVTSNSWNGGAQTTPNTLADTTATSGTASTVVASGASWTVDAYKNHIVKIISGTANSCWGAVKSNTATTITVYGSWLSSGYASNCGTPDSSSHFRVYADWGLYDNSWIGDYTCTGNFPSGTVVHHSYPTSGTIALETADCYDGKRDLLPNEIDRAVVSGTATAATATSITDSAKSLDPNVWVGQKVLITGGTGSGSYGYIESNTATAITVTDWLGGADPDIGSTFKVIYIVPHGEYNPNAQITGAADDAKGTNGPLMAEALDNWRGTRLPDSSDFFGFCGYKNGGSDYENTTSAASADTSYGNYGGQAGRTDEFIDLANSGSWEWLSEQVGGIAARIAGNNACSYFGHYNVHAGYRFRAVFRP